MQNDVPNSEFILSLSSLLHDIGKVRQRYVKDNTHQFHSNKVVREMHELTGLDNSRVYFLVSNLVLHHHTKDEELPEELRKDEEFMKLLNILKFSDWKSAGHDREDRDPNQTEDFKNQFTVALEKIFSHLKEWKGDIHYFPMYMLHDSRYLIDFFRDRESWDRGSTNFDSLKNIDEYFVKASSSIRLRQGFRKEFVNKLTSVLMDSVRTVPSAFWYSKAEITLFDHLKTTAAIANCKLYNDAQFLLISADTSGIQDYIFRYVKAEGADDRASRRIRGRSFIVRLLSDAIQSLLEIRLGLYGYNTVYDGSGGFLIMCPLREETEKKLVEIREEIDHFCNIDFKRIWSVLAWKRVSFDDLITSDGGAETTKLITEIQEMREESGRKKSRKGETVMKNEYGLFFNPIESRKKICSSCGLEIVSRGEKCLWCLREESLGSKLVKNHGKLIIHKNVYDSTTTEKFDDEDSLEFTFGNTRIVYTVEEHGSQKPAVYSEDISINDSDFTKWNRKENQDRTSWKFIFLGNNAPTLNNNDSEQIMPFDVMAGCQGERGRGERHCMPLATVKMDVDGMGKLMAYGFSKPTLSKISTISYFISFFFSVFLNKIAEEHNIYIIFSGGDDITAVGEVRNALDFSTYLRKCFRNWAGPHTGLSCGIETMHHSYPIRRSVEQAERNLSKSKSFRGKDSITVFDNTMAWDAFDSSGKIADKIYTRIKEKKLGSGFPYLLINLDQKNPYKGGKPDDVMIPDYYLYYYLSRNFGGKDMKRTHEMEELYEMIRKKDNFEHIGVTSRVTILKVRGDR